MAGVTQFGFDIKSLESIRVDIEAQMIAAIGAGFDTSVDTPQGQMIGVFSDSQATLWELAQDIYASFDVRQATGVRLDALARLRGLTRILGESDADFRRRLTVSQNVTEKAVQNIQSAVSLLDGVARVLVYYNDTGVQSADNLQPLTASISVEGGDDAAIAQVISDNLVFGLGLVGNTTAHIENANGICRTIRFTRPLIHEIKISIITDVSQSIGVCNGTSIENVKDLLFSIFSSDLSGLGQTATVEFIKAHLLVAGIGVSSIVLDEDAALSQVSLPIDTVFSLLDENLSVSVGG